MTKQISFDAKEQQMYVHILRGYKRLESDLRMHFLRFHAHVKTFAASAGS
jgi:hypothetical protein